MAKIVILGATGSLGKHVLQQAVAAGHDVSVVVRTPSKLAAELRDRISVHQCDLMSVASETLNALLRGHDAVINTAGVVTDGQVFVDLVDRLVTTLEGLPTEDRPACWFMAGVGVLDVDGTGRRGVDLPRIDATYWPHRVNFERLRRSSIDWRLLCPGPMVERTPIGLARLRTSLDRLPVDVPRIGRMLPGALFLPVFGLLIPQMIVPYADAASVLLANLERGGSLSGHRVGLALPLGMRGKKDQWIARPKVVP